MQFTNRARRQGKLRGERDPDLYPHTLQFYKYPPTDNITLEEFEKLALERLQVLRIVERAGAKYNRNSNDYKEAIFGELRKLNLAFYYKISTDEVNETVYDERRRDHISHFILRLAYCRSEDLRRWFISQEVDLFRLRFMSERSTYRKLFMELNQLNYKPIETHEKKDLTGKLAACGYGNSSSKVEGTDYYKVPFTEVIDLVKSRKVYLRYGYAFLPESDLVSIVVSAFRSHLSHALTVTARAVPQLEEDGRLLNILGTIHQRYIGTDYAKKQVQYTGEVVPEMIDGLAKESFPLCMRVLHETLRKNHHLKHGGRLQYGLFLKGIGLNLDDALRFWRSEFTRVMDMDKFDKQYAYNIRYNYGKEGKRTNYTPYNCMKIITTNAPGPGECHGCPFKHSDASNLRQRLSSLQINPTATSEIMDLVAKDHYQLACTRYFEATHNETNVDQGVNHPNQYFELSQNLKKGVGSNAQKGLKKVDTTRTVVYNEEDPPDNITECEMDFDMEDIEDMLKGV